ncbi:membrane protein [Lysobacter xinjiangensis]|uniref:Membrane protein n=1 Tax=Cognatilysobacter xinjiangensis TaxID=546892 RepID=A0ABQ3BV44_9GAMM|nr:AsmA family protein [Lysobacter xinjiangensis]GGZ53515.1 membrane protein [Lysobacter xinjiangensis]
MATETADTPDSAPTPPTGGPLAALRRHPIRTLLALLAVAIVVLIVLWDWNWFRRPIEKIVHAKTGRTLHIAGDLDVDLGWVPVITADRITFSNADWARRPLMASTDRLRFAVDLKSLFRRRVVIPSLALTRPVVNLERGKQGGNWVFDKEDDGGNDVQFRNLWVEDGKLEYLDTPRRMDIALQVQNEKAEGDGPPPIVAKGSGHWQGNAFTMSGRAESPLRLKDADTPYRVDIRAAAGRTRAHARGTLLDPLRLRDFDVKFALSGQNLEDLYPLFGIAMPPTPPYSLDGRLTRDRDGRRTSWHYNGFKGRVGDSDLSGDATYVTGGPRRFLKGRFVSHRLDFDDLAGFIGAAPQRGETTNPELAAKAARDAARSRLLPDEPYKLDKLRAMDADVTLRATRINAPSLPLDNMDAHLRLDNGVARLEPLNFGVAGGKVRSVIRMDARESPIRTRAQISASGLNLQQLLPRSEVIKDAVGKVGGEVALTGTGNSIAKILGSADGDVALGMGRGHISNLTMELAGLDVQEALKFLITKDRRIPVRCAFGDFAVKNGVMNARSLAFDTTDTIIIGEGSISLRDETLALKLRPRPKDRSLFSFRAPLYISGSFKQPSFRPDMKRVGLRAALALALGNIAPPAALLATIEMGGGKNADCGGRYAR